jgi:hypothetical protein
MLTSSRKYSLLGFFLLASLCAAPAQAEPREMVDHPVVRLRSLDKITARTMTFEANVGATVKFGSLYIKAQSCRKTTPLDQPEAASFLQVWQVNDETEEAEWVFSGWMFASSPGLSSMDHSIYDVWVLDCLETKGTVSAEEKREEEERGEGELEAHAVPSQPDQQPQDQFEGEKLYD